MRLSILWRIMEIEEGVIRRGRRPRRITPSEMSFRVVQLRKYSANSRCRPPSCLLAVFAMFFAIIMPSSSCSFYSWNEWSLRYFYFHNQNNSVSFPRRFNLLHFWRGFLAKHKILPNLVIRNWLWWTMRVLSQSETEIFWMNNNC